MTQPGNDTGNRRSGTPGTDHGKIDPAGRDPGAVPPSSPSVGEGGSRSTLLQTFKAVGSALFGVRSASGHRTDMSRLNPVHVILAGLLAAAVFIGLLIFFVKMMLRASGVA